MSLFTCPALADSACIPRIFVAFLIFRGCGISTLTDFGNFRREKIATHAANLTYTRLRKLFETECLNRIFYDIEKIGRGCETGGCWLQGLLASEGRNRE
jgi:hypothetical protein